jgi:hypothetical protein
MKDNTESISQNVFTHFPPVHENQNQTHLLFDTVKKCAIFLKGQILSGFVTLGIGTILFASIYLFFIQLAKYGWQ